MFLDHMRYIHEWRGNIFSFKKNICFIDCEGVPVYHDIAINRFKAYKDETYATTVLFITVFSSCLCQLNNI